MAAIFGIKLSEMKNITSLSLWSYRVQPAVPAVNKFSDDKKKRSCFKRTDA